MVRREAEKKKKNEAETDTRIVGGYQHKGKYERRGEAAKESEKER